MQVEEMVEGDKLTNDNQSKNASVEPDCSTQVCRKYTKIGATPPEEEEEEGEGAGATMEREEQGGDIDDADGENDGSDGRDGDVGVV